MRGPSDRSAVNSRRSCCPTIPARAGESSSSARRRPGGWWRCGWCRREWTSRDSRSGSTPPPPRRRCSSPRQSDGSCAVVVAVSWPACSCPPSRSCSPTPVRSNASATTCSGARSTPTTCGARRRRCSPRPTAPDGRPIWRASRRRWRRTLSSIMCCSTPAPTACRPSRPARTRPTTSACPGCWRPTRWRPCWPTGSAGSSPGRAVARSGSGSRRRSACSGPSRAGAGS